MVFAGNKRNLNTIERAKGLIARSGILAILIFSLFSYPGNILPIKLNFVLLLALTPSQIRPIMTGKAFVNLKHIGVRINLAIFIIVLLVLSYPFFKKWHQAHIDWQTAYYTYQVGAYESSLEDFEKALPLLTNNGTFLVNYGKALSMAEKHKEAVDVLNNAQNYLSNTIVFTAMGDSYKALGQNTKAEESYYHAWHMIPSRFYPKYLLAKLYDETGQRKKALEIASELLNKDIKIQSTAIEEIKNEMKTILKNEGKY